MMVKIDRRMDVTARSGSSATATGESSGSWPVRGTPRSRRSMTIRVPASLADSTAAERARQWSGHSPYASGTVVNLNTVTSGGLAPAGTVNTQRR
jgi:hypothetical protein